MFSCFSPKKKEIKEEEKPLVVVMSKIHKRIVLNSRTFIVNKTPEGTYNAIPKFTIKLPKAGVQIERLGFLLDFNFGTINSFINRVDQGPIKCNSIRQGNRTGIFHLAVSNVEKSDTQFKLVNPPTLAV